MAKLKIMKSLQENIPGLAIEATAIATGALLSRQYLDLNKIMPNAPAWAVKNQDLMKMGLGLVAAALVTTTTTKGKKNLMAKGMRGLALGLVLDGAITVVRKRILKNAPALGGRFNNTRPIDMAAGSIGRWTYPTGQDRLNRTRPGVGVRQSMLNTAYDPLYNNNGMAARGGTNPVNMAVGARGGGVSTVDMSAGMVY